jgi:phospholipid/cholesterol/gamma-HCH transport system substrate-binding protein
MRRRDEVMVGLVISVAFVIAVLGTLWLVRGGLASGYPLYTRFPWGYGIKQGQEVLLTGVNIGFVGDVDLRPDGTLLVTMRINKRYRVPEGTTATIEPNGIFGDVEVALHPVRPTTSYIPPGDTIPVGKSPPNLRDLLARVDTVGTHLNDVARTVQLELVQKGGIAELRKTLVGANQLVAQLSSIAAEQSRQLSVSMRSLNRTVSAIDSASVDSAVKNLKATTANLASLSGEMRTSATELNTLLAKADTGSGTAGKLLNDPAVYNNLQGLLARLDSLTADLKKHPGRYISLKIF